MCGDSIFMQVKDIWRMCSWKLNDYKIWSRINLYLREMDWLMLLVTNAGLGCFYLGMCLAQLNIIG